MQSCQVPAHMNRQLVGGRQQQQQQQIWAFLSWLNLFPPSFALLNSHLLFSLSLSFFSFLSLSAVVDPPHAEPPTHTHTYILHTHTHTLSYPLTVSSLSLSFPISTMAASTSADGHYESHQQAAELSLALSILQ